MIKLKLFPVHPQQKHLPKLNNLTIVNKKTYSIIQKK